jgi:hypothetical protein
VFAGFIEVIPAPSRTACRENNGNGISEGKRSVSSGTCGSASERRRKPGNYAAQGRGQRCNRLFEKDGFEGEAADGVGFDFGVIGVNGF